MTKVTIIGEACIDEYVYGKCHRVCPEAAALCFKRSDEWQPDQNLGMAGNVLNNIQSMSPNLDCALISNNYTNNPIIKRRFIDKRYNTIVFREDVNDLCNPWDGCPNHIEDSDYILISDYDKGFLTYDHYGYIRSVAPKATIFADTKKRIDINIAAAVDLIKINTDEYNNNVSKSNRILDYCEMIVTGGSAGCKLLSKKYIKNFATKNIEIRDVCGAGDTFLAALLVKYVDTKHIEKSIKYANKMAGLAVQKFGVVTP